MCSMPPAGYAGQRYAVSCLGFDFDKPDERKIVGWTNDPTGGALVDMIMVHPTWHSPEVKDLLPTPEPRVDKMTIHFRKKRGR